MLRLDNRFDWVVLLLDLSDAKIGKGERLWKVMGAPQGIVDQGLPFSSRQRWSWPTDSSLRCGIIGGRTAVNRRTMTSDYICFWFWDWCSKIEGLYGSSMFLYNRFLFLLYVFVWILHVVCYLLTLALVYTKSEQLLGRRWKVYYKDSSGQLKGSHQRGT